MWYSTAQLCYGTLRNRSGVCQNSVLTTGLGFQKGLGQKAHFGFQSTEAARNPSAVMWGMVKRLQESRAQARSLRYSIGSRGQRAFSQLFIRNSTGFWSTKLYQFLIDLFLKGIMMKDKFIPLLAFSTWVPERPVYVFIRVWNLLGCSEVASGRHRLCRGCSKIGQTSV